MPGRLTVEAWKKNYWFGLGEIKNPATGEDFPTESYQYHLDMGYESLSLALGIAVLQETIVDQKYDYHMEDYKSWGFFALYRKPVLEITSLEGRYPATGTVLTIPEEWIVLEPRSGHVNLIPASGTMNQFIFSSGGAFVPHLFQFHGYVPQFWRVSYTAGWADADIPDDLNDAAAKLAAISVANVLGDLVGGVGVLGSSVGMDGLSQFLTMTKTATTSAFYSRVLQYRTELFGSGQPGMMSQMHLLKRRYVGLRMTIL